MAKGEVQNLGGFVWSIAEILRGDFKQSEYGKVLLPFVALRQIDLHPDKVSNLEMSYLFEELIRRFSEISSEYAMPGGGMPHLREEASR